MSQKALIATFVEDDEILGQWVLAAFYTAVGT